MHIHLASDHAGYTLKEVVKHHLGSADYELTDHGAHEHNPADDYPPFIRAAAQAVAGAESGEVYGIIFGGSGQGEAMVANRVPGIRAAVYYGGPKEIITLSREHNDANVLSLGARFVTEEEALEAVTCWLNTAFSHEARHRRRIEQIENV